MISSRIISAIKNFTIKILFFLDEGTSWLNYTLLPLFKRVYYIFLMRLDNLIECIF